MEVELELTTLKREREWLLKEEAPRVFKAIHAHLERCTGILKGGLSLTAAAGNVPQVQGSSSVALAAPLEAAAPKKSQLTLDEILAQARSGGKKKDSAASVSSNTGSASSLRSAEDSDDETAAKTPSSSLTPLSSSKTPEPRVEEVVVPRYDQHADEQTRIISFKAQEGVSGFVVLQGYLLMEAELVVSLHRGARAPLEVQIRPTRPWRLTQLHNCLHYVKEAARSASLEPSIAFEPTLQALRCALDELLLGNPRMFPNSFPDARVFHPRLPADVTMEFSINDARLVCQVLLLRPASGAKKLRQYGSTLRPGDVCVAQGGKVVEVSEVLRVDSEVPKIKDVFDSLSVCFVALSNLRSQYEALLE